MQILSFHKRPRSLGAQRARMAKWPQFQFEQLSESLVRWRGPLRGFQRQYIVAIYWDAVAASKPYVVLVDPPLQPREGTTFEDVPHLIFNSEKPSLSGLCLFDPNGFEWSNKQLIADTTVIWTAEWLFYYEMWHLDGVWRGGGVGPESIAEARATAIHGQTDKLTTDPSAPTALAGR